MDTSLARTRSLRLFGGVEWPTCHKRTAHARLSAIEGSALIIYACAHSMMS